MSESSPADDSSSGSVSMSSPIDASDKRRTNAGDGDLLGLGVSAAAAPLDPRYASLRSAYVPFSGDGDGDVSFSVGGDGSVGEGIAAAGDACMPDARARRPNLTLGSGSSSTTEEASTTFGVGSGSGSRRTGDAGAGDTGFAATMGSLNGLLVTAAGDLTNAGDLGGFRADGAGLFMTGVFTADDGLSPGVEFKFVFVGVDVADGVIALLTGLLTGLGWTFAGTCCCGCCCCRRVVVGAAVAGLRRPRVSTSSSCCHSHCHDDCHSQSRASLSAIFTARSASSPPSPSTLIVTNRALAPRPRAGGSARR